MTFVRRNRVSLVLVALGVLVVTLVAYRIKKQQAAAVPRRQIEVARSASRARCTRPSARRRPRRRPAIPGNPLHIPSGHSRRMTMTDRRWSRPATVVLTTLLLAGCAAARQEPTLYERLGGARAIYTVVDDFVGRVTTDPRVKRYFEG